MLFENLPTELVENIYSYAEDWEGIHKKKFDVSLTQIEAINGYIFSASKMLDIIKKITYYDSKDKCYMITLLDFSLKIEFDKIYLKAHRCIIKEYNYDNYY